MLSLFPFSKERRRPAVIISNDETCQNADIEEVNALLCTSARANREPKITEEISDEADGLDWKTMVRCDRIHLLPKSGFAERKGIVTEERRPLIARKIVEVKTCLFYRQWGGERRFFGGSRVGAFAEITRSSNVLEQNT